MFTDVIALGLGLFGVWIADQPATEHKTYGYHRAEILVALINGLVLVARRAVGLLGGVAAHDDATRRPRRRRAGRRGDRARR